MGGEPDLLAGGQDRLAVRRRNGPGVGDVRAEERDAAADVLGRRRTGKLRTDLHGDVAALAVGRGRRGRRERGRAVRAGVDGQRGKEELLVGVVQQAE